MNAEKEQERHAKVILSIKEAKSKNELPKITISTLLKYFSDNAYFEEKLLPSLFEPVYSSILEHGYFISPDVKKDFIGLLKKYYPGHTEEEYEEKYKKINPEKINYILNEIYLREEKLEQLEKEEDLEKHNEIIKKINSSYEIKDIPVVTKATLNSFICSNSRVFPNTLKSTDISEVSDMLLSGKNIKDNEVVNKLFEICKNRNPDNIENYFTLFFSKISFGNKITYITEETKARQNRILEIYRENHEETMQNIKNAKRISQLPPNLTVSILSNYLSGNTTIYPKADQISSAKFVNISNLLLKGKTFENDEIKQELKLLAEEHYPKNEEAYILLYEKLSNLPRIKYLVEEINYSRKRQEEFIGRSASNVNVYLVPNPKSPVEGGRFYNCYINRIDNLDLGEILPLNLNEIIPEGMDVDAVEWYIQENYDETFKTAGGIILNKDESIGNVNIFKPTNDKIEITKEQQSKYQELEELSKQVKIIIARKKEETATFAKLQEEFLKKQLETDQELALLEEKIDILTQNNKRGNR